MKRALSSLRSKRFRVVLEQRNTEERRGTGFSILAARKMEREPSNAGGEGGGGRMEDKVTDRSRTRGHY